MAAWSVPTEGDLLTECPQCFEPMVRGKQTVCTSCVKRTKLRSKTSAVA